MLLREAIQHGCTQFCRCVTTDDVAMNTLFDVLICEYGLVQRRQEMNIAAKSAGNRPMFRSLHFAPAVPSI
jgi:hypothetical protein